MFGRGLLAIAVGAGLQVMAAMMAADVDAWCGPQGPARCGADGETARVGGGVGCPGRAAAAGAPAPGAAVDGSGEVPIAAPEAFAGTDVLGRRAMEAMLGGLSCRRYGVGLEPVGEQVSAEATEMSKSAVSRRFVTATEHALTEMMSADLSGVDLVRVHGRRGAFRRPRVPRRPVDPHEAARRPPPHPRPHTR